MNLCITALPFFKVSGEPVYNSDWQPLVGGRNCYLPHVYQVSFSSESLLCFIEVWLLPRMEEAKVSIFFPGTLVPPGLGCNILDSG